MLLASRVCCGVLLIPLPPSLRAIWAAQVHLNGRFQVDGLQGGRWANSCTDGFRTGTDRPLDFHDLLSRGWRAPEVRGTVPE